MLKPRAIDPFWSVCHHRVQQAVRSAPTRLVPTAPNTMSNESKATVDEPDSQMTAQEREDWLRDRGVVVETPSDRRRVESILTGDAAEGRPMSIVEQIKDLSLASGSDSGDEGVKFVYIPHDTSRDMVTLTLPKRLVEALGPAGDIIPTYVKSFFADGRSIDEALFKEQASKQNLMGAGDLSKLGGTANPSVNLTSNALTMATAGGSVETFPLVRPSSTNQNEGVYIYLDEVGLLKHLPNNNRATKLASQCGYNPAPNFYGDVFVGRVTTKNFMHNIDIKTEDIMDTKREWMVRAPQENLWWQQAMNEATGKKGQTQPGQAGTDGVAVEVDSSKSSNGCSYSWLQNEEEVEITVPLSKKLEGKKVVKSLIKVSFLQQKIHVKYDSESILELKLYSKLDVDGCTWTLDKENLVVTGEKASEGEMWPFLCHVNQN